MQGSLATATLYGWSSNVRAKYFHKALNAGDGYGHYWKARCERGTWLEHASEHRQHVWPKLRPCPKCFRSPS